MSDKNKLFFCHLPPIMYTTTSIIMPTLLNMNAVNWRQCSLARSANGGGGNWLCRLRSDRCRSIEMFLISLLPINAVSMVMFLSYVSLSLGQKKSYCLYKIHCIRCLGHVFIFFYTFEQFRLILIANIRCKNRNIIKWLDSVFVDDLHNKKSTE